MSCMCVPSNVERQVTPDMIASLIKLPVLLLVTRDSLRLGQVTVICKKRVEFDGLGSFRVQG